MNPFVYNSPVNGADFINREKAIADINGAVFGKSQGNMWITGARQTGKTSLLRKIQDLHTTSSQTIVHYDSGTEKRVRFIRANVQDCATEDQFYNVLRQALKNDFDYKVKFKPSDAREQFGKVVRYIFEKEGCYPVLLIDEFDAFITNVHENKADSQTIQQLFIRLNTSLTDTDGVSFRMWSAVFTSNHSIKELFERLGLTLNGSGLVTDSYELPLFTEEQAAQLVNTYLANSGYTFDKKEILLCFNLTKGYPIFIQMAFSFMYEIIKENPQIKDSDRKKAIKQYAQKLQETTGVWAESKMPSRTQKLLKNVFNFAKEKNNAIITDAIADINWSDFITQLLQ